MRISDWSSDVCSSDLAARVAQREGACPPRLRAGARRACGLLPHHRERPPRAGHAPAHCRGGVMSLRLFAQLHGAFGEKAFAFPDYCADQRGHRAPVRDDVDAFVDEMTSYVSRGLLLSAAALDTGDGIGRATVDHTCTN